MTRDEQNDSLVCIIIIDQQKRLDDSTSDRERLRLYRWNTTVVVVVIAVFVISVCNAECQSVERREWVEQKKLLSDGTTVFTARNMHKQSRRV